MRQILIFSSPKREKPASTEVTPVNQQRLHLQYYDSQGNLKPVYLQFTAMGRHHERSQTVCISNYLFKTIKSRKLLSKWKIKILLKSQGQHSAVELGENLCSSSNNTKFRCKHILNIITYWRTWRSW